MFEEADNTAPFPHPPLSLRLHLIVEQALRAAWEIMLSQVRVGFDLQTADEDTITLELYQRLYDEIFNKGVVDGFDGNIFTSVHREPKIRNFNYSNPDKMPDLFVDFVDRPARVMNSQHGLFIECKPVDREHPTGSAYCDKGLIRFIRGDYAWTMQSAMMVGYTRKGYTLLDKLPKALKSKRKEPISTSFGPSNCTKSVITTSAEQVAISKHPRTFDYVENGSPAGTITIRHLWLKRES
ncbi:hypothetical protein [Pelagicoccus sp. SDUM812002]|uniref:hypothetical protein n=1 Tax=Pelagicoccus sp. SDUM812002 TaxID=3041266 RepID=UPI002810FAF0|nr:hypothetical protein [Pelagicoccus sp. SDUM812002]